MIFVHTEDLAAGPNNFKFTHVISGAEQVLKEGIHRQLSGESNDDSMSIANSLSLPPTMIKITIRSDRLPLLLAFYTVTVEIWKDHFPPTRNPNWLLFLKKNIK